MLISSQVELQLLGCPDDVHVGPFEYILKTVDTSRNWFEFYCYILLLTFVFQEAHAMVLEANTGRAASQKSLKEASGKVCISTWK